MDSSSVFRTTVPVEIINTGSNQTINLNTSDELKTYKFTLDSKPLCVVFNKGNAVLCKLYFSKPKKDWLYQLKNSTDAIDRITAIKGLKDFVNDEDALKILNDAMNKDKFWGVRNEAALVLRYSKLNKAALDLMDYYSHEKDQRIRGTILTSLAVMKNNCSNCIDGQQVSAWILSKINSEQGYYAIADGVNALSQILPKDKIYDAVFPFLSMDSHNEIIRRNVLDAMKKSEDKRALEIFLQYAGIGSTARLRSSALGGLANFTNDIRVIDMLHMKLSDHNRRIQTVALNLIEKMKDGSAMPYLEEAYNKTNDDEFKKRIKAVMDKIY
jgi:aminopeptidase N